jgi:hypothetical protein
LFIQAKFRDHLDVLLDQIARVLDGEDGPIKRHPPLNRGEADPSEVSIFARHGATIFGQDGPLAKTTLHTRLLVTDEKHNAFLYLTL